MGELNRARRVIVGDCAQKKAGYAAAYPALIRSVCSATIASCLSVADFVQRLPLHQIAEEFLVLRPPVRQTAIHIAALEGLHAFGQLHDGFFRRTIPQESGSRTVHLCLEHSPLRQMRVQAGSFSTRNLRSKHSHYKAGRPQMPCCPTQGAICTW